MLFNTAEFFVFLAVVLALFYLPGLQRDAWRRPMLLVASYLFYMSWNWRFVPLLLGLTAIDYLAAFWIERASTQRQRMRALLVSLCANLGLLAFFKYYNFAAANVAWLLGQDPKAFALQIILPLGISFHTFQSMSYVIDVYRREQEPIRNPVDYALFVAFFPQLVAGPIVRAREFFVDLYHWRAPVSREVLEGMLLVIVGLAKKMVVADRFAQVSDGYFQNVAAHPGMVAAWSGAVSFAIQIYFDFSGYTDMAIGMAKLFGFHFPLNFRRPYLAPSITEFWRRWHMSLSRWLRDYLYIPLGGNRGGSLLTYRNLMLTMLLGGLWHGASWNFVIWGGFHGALLAMERLLGVRSSSPLWRLLYPVRVVWTFVLVTIGWVFFRAATAADSVYVLRQMFAGSSGGGAMLIPLWMVVLALLMLLFALLEEKWQWIDGLAEKPAWVYGVTCALLLFAVEALGYTEAAVPFVYFQF